MNTPNHPSPIDNDDLIVLTPEEIAELARLDARAAKARSQAELKEAQANAAFEEYRACWGKLDAHLKLRGGEGSDGLRAEEFRAMQAWETANAASEKARRAAERAGNHRVVRTFTDNFIPRENPNFFLRRFAAQRRSATQASH